MDFIDSDSVDEPPRSSASAQRPHLVLVGDGAATASGGARFRIDAVSEIVIGRGRARGAVIETDGDRSTLHVTLSTPAVSSIHARIVREGESWIVLDAGSRNGTWVNGVRATRAPIGPADCVQVGSALFVLRPEWTTPSNVPLDVPWGALDGEAPGHRTLVPSLQQELAQLRAIARSSVPVLLLGPTGAGKELLARAVHDDSRRTGAFVAVNCGALPSTLVEASLFGHARGAFTGAVRDELGFLRAADGGTLFLDEIGDLPLPSQAALLRVLQENEVTPLGATRPLRVDVRVVAATNRPIASLTASGLFRPDLLARLRGYVHVLPALDARREDLGLLVAAILAREPLAERRDPAITRDAFRALFRYRWPLNVRELEQTLGAARALAPSGVVSLDVLPAEIAASAAAGERPSAAGATSRDAAAHASLRDRLVRELSVHEGNVTAVGRALGKAPVQIRRWMKRFGVRADDYRA